MEADPSAPGFLHSSLVEESPVFDNSDVVQWLRDRGAATRFEVTPIPFAAMEEWGFEPGTRNLVHASGRFFRIEGLRVETSFEDAGQWDQPIIHQPEIGILGILSKCFGGVRHFLMQAKAEPGNVGVLQLSPTVQATRSNYTKVHKGREPSYLEYFSKAPLARRLVDQLQTEQGSRFLKKRNRNMVVDVGDDVDVPVLDGFRWLTLGEIRRLQSIDNFVNMDARSVISCIPYEAPASPLDLEPRRGFARDLLDSLHAGSGARHGMDELLGWLTEMKVRYPLDVESIPLSETRRWVIGDAEIAHESGDYFSVIAVDVEAEGREVSHWTQPLIRDASTGLHGFVTQKHGGLLHFLVQAKVEPGNLDGIALAPTVSCANVEARRKAASPRPFLDRFLDAPPEEVRYSVVQSEEGGRFYHLQNRNTLLEVAPDAAIDAPDHFVWMTLGQLLEFLRFGHLSIDARTLLACASWT